MPGDLSWLFTWELPVVIVLALVGYAHRQVERHGLTCGKTFRRA